MECRSRVFITAQMMITLFDLGRVEKNSTTVWIKEAEQKRQRHVAMAKQVLQQALPSCDMEKVWVKVLGLTKKSRWWLQNILYVHPYLGKWSNLDLRIFFQRGWEKPPTSNGLL